MFLSDGLVLDSVKFNAVIKDQFENYQETLPLRFLDRTAIIPADDDEITTYFTGKVLSAAVIADDQEAPVVEAGQLEYVTNTIPNIKMGQRFSQAMISRLNRIRNNLSNGGIRGDVSMFTQWETYAAARLVRGTRETMNQMMLAMMIDNFSYNSLGIQITGSWGMPSDLKFTPVAAWSSASTATPITDLLTARLYAQQQYGETYDRVTMTTPDFINMVSTTEFKNLLQGVVREPLATTAFNVRSPQMEEFASVILNMTIEQENKLRFVQGPSGTITSTRVLPTGTVLLSVKSDDNNPDAYNFGNAIVTESQVASLVGGFGNVPTGEQFGPFGYYTGSFDLNPPNLRAWSVARGFPRKFRKTCTAIITGV